LVSYPVTNPEPKVTWKFNFVVVPVVVDSDGVITAVTSYKDGALQITHWKLLTH
jgi:hypothetical protein